MIKAVFKSVGNKFWLKGRSVDVVTLKETGGKTEELDAFISPNKLANRRGLKRHKSSTSKKKIGEDAM